MPSEPYMPHKNGYTNKQWTEKLAEYAADLAAYHERKELVDKMERKVDWVRRFNQFADRYCNGDKRRCTHMLKHVSLWKEWLDLKREYKEIDWSIVQEEKYEIEVNTIGAQACSGSNCDAGDLGLSIREKTLTA